MSGAKTEENYFVILSREKFSSIQKPACALWHHFINVNVLKSGCCCFIIFPPISSSCSKYVEFGLFKNNVNKLCRSICAIRGAREKANIWFCARGKHRQRLRFGLIIMFGERRHNWRRSFRFAWKNVNYNFWAFSRIKVKPSKLFWAWNSNGNIGKFLFDRRTRIWRRSEKRDVDTQTEPWDEIDYRKAHLSLTSAPRQLDTLHCFINKAAGYERECCTVPTVVPVANAVTTLLLSSILPLCFSNSFLIFDSSFSLIGKMWYAKAVRIAASTWYGQEFALSWWESNAGEREKIIGNCAKT